MGLHYASRHLVSYIFFQLFFKVKRHLVSRTADAMFSSLAYKHNKPSDTRINENNNNTWTTIQPVRCFDFPKKLTMSRIIRVIIQKSLYQNINRKEVNYC